MIVNIQVMSMLFTLSKHKQNTVNMYKALLIYEHAFTGCTVNTQDIHTYQYQVISCYCTCSAIVALLLEIALMMKTNIGAALTWQMARN